jgi:hypothetical protein
MHRRKKDRFTFLFKISKIFFSYLFSLCSQQKTISLFSISFFIYTRLPLAPLVFKKEVFNIIALISCISSCYRIWRWFICIIAIILVKVFRQCDSFFSVCGFKYFIFICILIRTAKAFTIMLLDDPDWICFKRFKTEKQSHNLFWKGLVKYTIWEE